MGGAFIRAGCGGSHAVVNLLSNRSFVGYEGEHSLLVYLQDVALHCSDVTVTTPCVPTVQQSSYYPKLFWCVWAGDTVTVAKGPFWARKELLLEDEDDTPPGVSPSVIGWQTTVECPLPTHGELETLALDRVDDGRATLDIVHGETADSTAPSHIALPFAGFPGGNRVSLTATSPPPPSLPPAVPSPSSPPSPTPVQPPPQNLGYIIADANVPSESTGCDGDSSKPGADPNTYADSDPVTICVSQARRIAGVRCCRVNRPTGSGGEEASWLESTGVAYCPKGSCEAFTYAEALNHCAAQPDIGNGPYRLCSQREVIDELQVRNTGCSYDFMHVWTSTRCAV